MTSCSKDYSFTMLELLIENLREDIKPVSTESRDNSVLIAFLGLSGQPGFRCKGQSKWFGQEILLYCCKVFAGYLDKDIKPLVTEMEEFEYWDTSLLITLFGSFGQQDSDANVKKNDFSFGSATTSAKRSIETAMEEIKPVVT